MDFEKLQRYASKPRDAEATPSGYVFNIRVVPDLFTGELLNVGVCVVGPGGRRLVRVIDRVGRLECLYGPDAKNVVVMASIAAEAAAAGAEHAGPTIQFSTAVPFFGVSPEQMLEEAFADRVTVAIPTKPADDVRPVVTTEDVVSNVYDYIRSRGRALVHDAIIPQALYAHVEVDGRTRAVRVPLQARTAIGGLESADYSPHTLKVHLMDSLLDLGFAAQARDIPRLAMFILRPSKKQSERELAQIDDSIDGVLFRAPRPCSLEIGASIDELGEKILEWADAEG